MAGISSRQGGHHVAQKFRTTTLPLRDAREWLSPLVSISVNAGATKPVRGASIMGAPAEPSGMRVSQVQAALANRTSARTVQTRCARCGEETSRAVLT